MCKLRRQQSGGFKSFGDVEYPPHHRSPIVNNLHDIGSRRWNIANISAAWYVGQGYRDSRLFASEVRIRFLSLDHFGGSVLIRRHYQRQ